MFHGVRWVVDTAQYERMFLHKNSKIRACRVTRNGYEAVQFGYLFIVLT